MRHGHVILILVAAAVAGLAACGREARSNPFDSRAAMDRLRAAQASEDPEAMLIQADQAIVLCEAALAESPTARRIVLAAHQMAAEAHQMAGRPAAATERIVTQRSLADGFLAAHPEDGLLRELLAGYWLERARKGGPDVDPSVLKARGWRVLTEAVDQVLPEGFVALVRRAAAYVAAEQAADDPVLETARSAQALAFMKRLRTRPEWSDLDQGARTEILHVEGSLRVRAGDLGGARACLEELEASDPGAVQTLRLEQLIRTTRSGR